MVQDAGKVSAARRSSRRSYGGAVLVFAVAVANACGGRSTLLEDQGFAGDGGDGAEGGTGGVGGTNTGGGKAVGGTGGSISVGGTGTGASPGTGGYPGKGGYPGTGGYPGKGGSPGTGGYPGKGGSPGKGGFGGSIVAGYGGDTYPAGYGGTIGRGGGGYGGSVYPAGSGGRGGKGGFGGKGGSPGKGGSGGSAGNTEVYYACQYACENLPELCLGGTDRRDCATSCAESGFLYPGCQKEFAEYAYCIGGNVWRSADCYFDGSSCYGYGCTDYAVSNCQDYADRFSVCLNGCSTQSNHYGTSCDLSSYCGYSSYYTYCYQTGTDRYWSCACYIDGALVSGVAVNGSVMNQCELGSDYCGFPRY